MAIIATNCTLRCQHGWEIPEPSPWRCYGVEDVENPWALLPRKKGQWDNDLPSGKRLRNELENHHVIAG